MGVDPVGQKDGFEAKSSRSAGEPAIALIAAMARDRVIGRGNALPWHVPADLRFFRKMTLGHPVVMGRRTFDSVGKPLPGRLNLVVTRQKDWSYPGVEVFGSVDAALDRALEDARRRGLKEAFVAGGGEIYVEALGRADRIYLTRIDLEVAGGDAWFPVFEESFKEMWREEDPGPPHLVFSCYERLLNRS
jgi:dihydrofolate reductase